MISLDQIKELSNKYKIAESIVAREYFQILFLNELYSKSFAKDIVFKGGTCIRLIYGGERFSEDLDFTVNMSENIFSDKMKIFFTHLANTFPITVKEKDSIIGRTFLLTAEITNFDTKLFVKLDFSFREDVLEPTKNIMMSDYPIITSNYIFALSKNEILAEKIRAIMTREKLRDLYDLWILQELGATIDLSLINKKLKYYNETFNKDAFIKRLASFKLEDFITDLRPFVPYSQRDKLTQLFGFTKEYCLKSVGGI
ncbi:MAG: nucleotidyl transferase AbiEii/AbiGii toxin family protein [bacterium]